MIASFNTGALFWWITVMLGRGRHLFHSLLVYAFHSSLTGREAYAWDLTSDWIRKGSFELI